MELLVGNTINEKQLLEAYQRATERGITTDEALLELGHAPPIKVTEALAQYHGMHYVDLGEGKISAEVIDLVPGTVARDDCVLPLELMEGVLLFATSIPSDYSAQSKLQYILNRDVRGVLVSRKQLISAIGAHYLDLLVSMAAARRSREELDNAISRHYGQQRRANHSFRFRAIDPTGAEVEDDVWAESYDEALRKLRDRCLFVISMREK
jgi:hypothetical protein